MTGELIKIILFLSQLLAALTLSLSHSLSLSLQLIVFRKKKVFMLDFIFMSLFFRGTIGPTVDKDKHQEYILEEQKLR